MPSLRPRGGLWRHGDFMKLWSAESISQIGTQISALALPLVAVLVLDATAFQVAALTVVQFLPFILFTLPAGVWVDRLPRRPILIVGDLGRGVLLGSIPLAYAFDALTLGQLYVVGFVVGVCTVFFDVAYQSYLPSLVDRSQLVEGNSKLEISRSGAQLGGPGLAGALVGVVGAPIAVLADAISFLGSALFVVGIRKREEVPRRAEGAPKPRMRAELKEGLTYVLGNPYLRAISACTGTSNFFWSMTGAILVVYAVRELGMSPELIGLVFSLGNAGPLAAALTANRLSRRLGVGPTIVATAVLFSFSLLLVPAAPKSFPVPFLVGAAVLAGYGAVAYNITQVSFRQAICPERLQGRMNAVIRFLVWGTLPLGALLGGGLATWIGLRPAMWVAAIGATFTFLPVLLSPVRTLREMPEPPEEEQFTAPGGIVPPAPAPAGDG